MNACRIEGVDAVDNAATNSEAFVSGVTVTPSGGTWAGDAGECGQLCCEAANCDMWVIFTETYPVSQQRGNCYLKWNLGFSYPVPAGSTISGLTGCGCAPEAWNGTMSVDMCYKETTSVGLIIDSPGQTAKWSSPLATFLAGYGNCKNGCSFMTDVPDGATVRVVVTGSRYHYPENFVSLSVNAADFETIHQGKRATDFTSQYPLETTGTVSSAPSRVMIKSRIGHSANSYVINVWWERTPKPAIKAAESNVWTVTPPVDTPSGAVVCVPL